MADVTRRKHFVDRDFMKEVSASLLQRDRLYVNRDLSVVLDFVRLAAAQMVLFGHAMYGFNVFSFLHHPHLPSMQQTGVVIFFFLSGLLISLSTVVKSRHGSYRFNIFFIDRFSRIYTGLIPSLLFILVVDQIYVVVLNGQYGPILENSDGLTFIGNVLNLQNYPVFKFWMNSLFVEPFGSGRPLWSLAIEWWIYMFFGWLFLAYRAHHVHWYYWLILAFVSVVPLWNMVAGPGRGLFTYVWFLGVLMAVAFSNLHRGLIKPWTALLLSVVFFLITCYRLKYYVANQIYDFHACFALGCALFFFLCIFRETQIFSKKLRSQVRLVADYSYTLYLIHYTVMIFLLGFNSHFSNTVLFFLCLILSNLFAFILAYFTEMRHRQFGNWLKDRFGVV